MSFLLVDDQMPFHKKIVAAGNEAIGAWVRAGAWSKNYGTNGIIPREVALAIAAESVWERLMSDRVKLVRPRDGGDYELHDFLQWQTSAEQDEARKAALRQARSDAGKRSAERRRERRSSAPPTNTDATTGEQPSSKPPANCEQTANKNPTPSQMPNAIPQPDPPPTPPGGGGGIRAMDPGVVGFEQPYWSAAYERAARAALADPGWTLEARQLRDLSAAVAARCPDRSRVADWLGEQVPRFIDATRSTPSVWSAHQPRGFKRWFDAKCPRDDARPSGVHRTRPAPQQPPPGGSRYDVAPDWEPPTGTEGGS